MPATLTSAASIYAVRTRITSLSANGSIAAGANSFTTSTLVKATITPVLDTGDDIAIKNASGDLDAWNKHPDMIKYGTLNIELARPDPQLLAACCGGTVLSDTTTAALGAPTGLTLTARTTLGTLATGTYGYRATQYNMYGESVAETEVTVAVTGPTGAVVVSGVTPAANAVGIGYYGNVPGSEQLLGYFPAIGSQTTSAASGTGSPTSVAVTSLTKPIPSGFQFQIAGDTNTRKIIFTTTAPAGAGATALQVTVSESITTPIAAAAIQPVFYDTGAVTPNGALPISDLSAGPGIGVGWQAPPLGQGLYTNPADPAGVSIEFFTRRIKTGIFATDYPYFRWVFPLVSGMHIMPSDITNANKQTIMEGQSWGNPNWGSGPFGDWTFDASQWHQYAACGAPVLPSPSVVAQPAL